MEIQKIIEGDKATLVLDTRLDTITAPDLEKEIQTVTSANSLVIDCSKLEYISSAGLRVLLSAHKAFASKGGMTVTNVCDMVLDIFEVTGFKEILNID